MAKDLNKVQMTGHLGADPEMRYTAQGSAVTTFRVASGRTWKDRDGNQHDDTEWFRVVAWDKLGEICNQYLTKGTRVYIEGRLQTRKWQGQDGQDRYTSEVIAQDMIILSPRGERGNVGDVPADMSYADDEEAAPTPARPTNACSKPTASAPAGAEKPNCYDNAAMESFFGRYKTSNVRQHIFADVSEARQNAFEYIEIHYNRFRKHSSIGYHSPMQFEENHRKHFLPRGG
ncbi:single-stranded DNA-binding protein, partial [Candidatus Gracilibacteria bacterium]|nr:single-stranded DNA-binding protein [Candidatus Gracilibacteria bacterium]